MLDVRRLEVLKTVVEVGSVTGAARTLGFSPSAVSQAVAALEREAKISLLEKVGRGIRPTEAAILLSEHADKVLGQLQRAEAELEALRSGKAGRLRVAAFATAGASLVPRALAGFKQDHADIDLDLSIAETPEALNALRVGAVDLALVGEHRPVADSKRDLLYTLLLEDPYRVVVPRDHPVANKSGVSLQELRDDPWVSTASARCNCLEMVTNACGRAGFTPRFALEADEFATTVGFVAAGLGVSMVPMLALASVPETVRVLQIRSYEPKRHVYCVVRPGSAGNPIVAAMQEELKRSAGSHLRTAA
jgi:DNA-binding transcriptional LysR family regulator